MEHYPTLRELLEGSEQSRQLFSKFTPDAQVALQEQRQSIHTYDDLQKIAASFEERRRGW
ncbi:MAG: hypothetical protein PHI98_04280 [Eubacteriales bacterium]|nr:hypothetical protein [Eubacteriales bacterium]